MIRDTARAARWHLSTWRHGFRTWLVSLTLGSLALLVMADMVFADLFVESSSRFGVRLAVALGILAPTDGVLAEGLWRGYGGQHFDGHHLAQLDAGLAKSAVLLGHILALTMKAACATALIVGTGIMLFGDAEVFLPTILCAVVVGAPCVAISVGFGVAAGSTKYFIAAQRLIGVVASLLSGAFIAKRELPRVLRFAVDINPFAHAIGLTYGPRVGSIWLSGLVFAGLIAAGLFAVKGGLNALQH